MRSWRRGPHHPDAGHAIRSPLPQQLEDGPVGYVPQAPDTDTDIPPRIAATYPEATLVCNFPEGNALMERHGPKAVFFGRFIFGLRTWASWLAGATKMDWRVFAAWKWESAS